MKILSYFWLLFALLLAGCAVSTTTIPTPVQDTATTAPTTPNTPTPTPRTLTSTLRATRTAPKTRTVAPTGTPTSTAVPTQTAIQLTPAAFENTPLPAAGEAISPASAQRIVPVAQWGKGHIQDIAYSPNGRILGAATSLGVYLYDSLALDLLAFYPTGVSVKSIQFSPDQKTFAWGYADGRIEIREVENGNITQAFSADPNPVLELAYSEDGRQITSIQDDVRDYQDNGVLYIWDLAQGQVTSSNGIERGDLFDLSSNGQVTAAGDEGSDQVYIDLLEVKTSEQISRITIQPYEYLYSVTLSQDARLLLTENYESVKIWRTDLPGSPIALSDVPRYIWMFYADSCKIEADGPGWGPVESAAFSLDGKLLVLGARQGGVQIYRTSDGALLASFGGWASQLLFAPDNQTFAMLPDDGSLEVHRAADGALLAQISGLSPFRSVAFSPDTRLLAAGAADNFVRVWRVADGQRALDLQTQANRVAFSPDGTYLAAGSDHGGLILWDLTSGESRRLAEDRMEPQTLYRINSLLFAPLSAPPPAPDRQSLLSGSQACLVESWDYPSGALNWQVENKAKPAKQEEYWSSNAPVNSIAILPDRQAAAANNYSALAFYNPETGEALAPLYVGERYWFPGRAFFQPFQDQVAIGDGNSFQVWNLTSSAMKYQVDTPVSYLTVSPDGQILITASNQGLITVWRAEDGQMLAALAGHRDEITQLVFSADGKYLASSSLDGTIRLWAVR